MINMENIVILNKMSCKNRTHHKAITCITHNMYVMHHIYIYINICIYMCVCIYIYIYIYIYMYISICTHVCIHICTYVCTYTSSCIITPKSYTSIRHHTTPLIQHHNSYMIIALS